MSLRGVPHESWGGGATKQSPADSALKNLCTLSFKSAIISFMKKPFFLFLFFCSFLFLSSNGFSATFNVTNTVDLPDANPRDGICDDGSGRCTLRAAMREAELNRENDLILLPPGLYELGKTIIFLEPTGDTEIRGAGRENTIIDGQNRVSLFFINGSSRITFQHLTMQNGLQNTDGVFEKTGGTMTLAQGAHVILFDTFLTENAASSGGAIFVFEAANLNISNSIISHNRVSINGRSCPTTISYGAVYLPPNNGEGGAIYNYGGNLSISNSQVLHNSSECSGGAIFNINRIYYNQGEVTAFYRSNLVVYSSNFSANQAGISGGAVFNASGEIHIDGSTFSQNTAQKGAALVDEGPFPTPGSRPRPNEEEPTNFIAIPVGPHTFPLNGNASQNPSSSTQMPSQNQNDSLKHHYGFVSLINSTFSGNQASDEGGSVWSKSWLEMTNNTIVNNSAKKGGGIYCKGCASFLKNTIIAFNRTNLPRNGNNCFGDLLPQNVAAHLFSHGGNIFGDMTGCMTYKYPNAVTNDFPIPSGQSLLMPLGNYGGPTETHALTRVSLSRDNADRRNCPATDQRGVTRPVGCGCDIGAFEDDRFDSANCKDVTQDELLQNREQHKNRSRK